MRAPISWVSLQVWKSRCKYDYSKHNGGFWINVFLIGKLTLISTFLVFRLNLTWSCRFSTMGVNILVQFSFNGVYLLAGMGILRISSGPWNKWINHLINYYPLKSLWLNLNRLIKLSVRKGNACIGWKWQSHLFTFWDTSNCTMCCFLSVLRNPQCDNIQVRH